MGLTKAANFSERQNLLSSYGKAIAHPARIAIIEYLVEHDTCICGDLVEVLPLSQPTISQHLKELKTIGIIKGEIEGTSVCYCINETVWKEIRQAMQTLFSKDVQTAKESCCSEE